ncbi:Fanconi anemia group G protein isoform X2 [Rhineura floridana]|uniref:Fanconi anemia group G protein isoform X2 n=1 Tax=Rhineura floridana TaxID=261503 RepID=UPI002AC891FC|nr:Fanconi anemia group G protein isoform X2 [Rhineura floridana]
MASARSCLDLWREENDELARRWRTVASFPGPDCSVTQTAQECQLAFTQLLQKIQGLPAALPALPLELTILYNSLVFDIHLSSDSGEKLLAVIDHGLSRVLEACAVSGQGLGSGDRWQRVLQEGTPEELQAPLHRLAALQGALWLAANRLGTVEGLFRLLNGTKSLEPSPYHGCKNELLPLLQTWHPPDMGEADPLLVQSVKDLKDILGTSAAFLQGVQELEAGDLPAAVALLQAAATGMCSRRVLAQIFTLMGSCHLKMGKPQMAIQHLRRALQVDFTFLPALHQAALLYHQLGLTEAELEVLVLLDQALDGPAQVTTESINPRFLIQTELLTCASQLTGFFVKNCPSEVKYLLAQRSFQAGRISEAVDHYLDLLALLQEEPLHQVYLCGKLALPRIPEVFLEAASALEDLARHEDAISVCEEVVTRTNELIPEKLRIELDLKAKEDMQGTARCSLTKSRSNLTKQKRESLLCVLWQAAAYLIQGWAWAGLGEAKEAISHLSRCLNDLLKVHFVTTGSNSIEKETEQMGLSEAKVLSQIRHLALTGRGTQFLEMGRDKEALMDFQHSLHVCPGSPTANLYLMHTLWKLDRRQEAAGHWQKFHLNPVLLEEEAERSFPLYLLSCVKQMKFPHMESLTRNVESCLGGSSSQVP